MIDSEHRVNNNNYQSFMVVEYIFRFMEIGETFTEADLLNRVCFKDTTSKKGYDGARKGINIALRLLGENRNGKRNVVTLSDDPKDTIIYKLIDNETSVVIEKNKTENFVSVDARSFQTVNCKESNYVPSLDLIEKLISVIPENKYSNVVKPSVEVYSNSSFEQQVRKMTDAQRIEAIVIIAKIIEEARADAVSVIDLMK